MFLFYYLYINCSGETGIRTPETLLTFTRFPGVPLQPLEHLSFFNSKNALRTMHNAFRLQKYLFFIRVAHYLGKNFSLQCPFWLFRLLIATLFG